MKKRLGKIATVVLCLGTALTGTALHAGGEGTLYLSLEQAQQFALDHNRTIANAGLDVRKAEAAKWQSIASMLPQVSASADYSNYCGYNLELQGMQIPMPAFISYGVTTSMAFSGGQILGVGIRNLSLKMSDISLRQSRREICDQTKTLYFSALVLEETINLLNESLESVQNLYTMSLKSVEVGISEQTDADQLLVQVTTMQNSISSTRRALEVTYNSLRLLLNVDPQTPIELTGTLENMLNLATVDVLQGEEFILDRNYSYQLLKASTELARRQISLTGWSQGPTLSVFHQYTGKNYLGKNKGFDMTPPNMIGVSFRIPIFTSLNTTSAIKDAKLSYQKQLNTLSETETSLRLQHRQFVYNLRTALDDFRAQSQNVDVAQRVFDNIAKKYEFGVASSMDVTNANTSLLTAKSNYIQSILDIMEAQISLEGLLNNDNARYEY
ncbi:MAG: TolC family protein [Bacteroidales bacterium]|nr:TolC family protein [Bacteroidales bacterium]